MTSLSLDADQKAVAEVDSRVRQLVIAPAGTGKTETVAALVDHLVTDGGLRASQEVLILSFSRAAVTALKRRLSAKDSSFRSINVRTLDALAARIIASDEGAGEPSGSFDARIVQATKVLRGGAVSDELEVVEHVIVDEVQDVVGVRAAFVLEILKTTQKHAGFTVLGDPEQAIYNFQLEDGGGMTSSEFQSYLDQQFAPVLRGLGMNYRAASDDARRFAALGARLIGLVGKQRIDVVRRELSSVLLGGTVAEVAGFLPRWAGTTTAFLCETNGVALSVRDELRENGIEAALQSSAEQRGVAAWVARVLDCAAAKVKKATFVEEWDESVGYSAQDAWRLLKRAERNFTSGETLEIKRLARAVARRDVPAELMEPPDADVVVSTVHRSKGLEFDNVVLVNTDRWLPADASNDDASEAYVALTRSRDRVVSATGGHRKGLRKDKKSDRWIIGGFKTWQTHGIEIRPADTRTQLDPARAPATAAYIRQSTAVGDPVVLRLNKAQSTLQFPVYDIEHGAQRIGTTSEDFGYSFARRVGQKKWPALSNLRIDGYETRGAGSEASAPGIHDLWLGVVVTGMADINWNDEDE